MRPNIPNGKIGQIQLNPPHSPAKCLTEFTLTRHSAVYTGGHVDTVHVVDRLGISAATAADLYRQRLVTDPDTSLAEVMSYVNRMIVARGANPLDPVEVVCNFSARNVNASQLGTWLSTYRGSIDLSHNHLRTLDWNLSHLQGDLLLHNNLLINVDGLPSIIDGALDLTNNEIEDYSGFAKVSKVTGTIKIPAITDISKILPIFNVDFQRVVLARTQKRDNRWIPITDPTTVHRVDEIERIINSVGRGRVGMLRALKEMSVYVPATSDRCGLPMEA